MQNKTYPISASKLYRMRNRRKLAKLLGVTPTFFRQKHEYKYNEFSKPKPNGDGERYFTVPDEDIMSIQKKICRLFARIDTPEWVMSGKKHHSYITNAERHIEGKFVKTMDISSFYDSASKSHIFDMFRRTFLMEPDISWLLTDLVTHDDKLPTGSPSSQLVVFWTYRNMFERINDIAQRNGCVFSLYVDDMTFSSQKPISRKLRNEVAIELKKCGLKAKEEKDHYYQGNDFKVITGVGIKKGKKLLPNRRRKKIIEQYKKCKACKEKKEFDRLKGMLISARQIEPNIFPGIMNYVKMVQKDIAK